MSRYHQILAEQAKQQAQAQAAARAATEEDAAAKLKAADEAKATQKLDDTMQKGNQASGDNHDNIKTDSDSGSYSQCSPDHGQAQGLAGKLHGNEVEDEL